MSKQSRAYLGSTGERSLWAAVLQQAIEDATLVEVEHWSRDRIMNARGARSWLADCRPDFRHVCYLAGLDPDAVNEALAERLSAAPPIPPLPPKWRPAGERAPEPGVGSNLPVSKGTGAGSTTQDIAYLEFSK
jgi:hypothetical protein